MPITVIVRSGGVHGAMVTFDGIESVAIGRGASCDVRLPDPSVSHRHASLRAKGTDFVLIDEGSTNGTFVGQVRIAARTSRIVRSGDMVRLGRVWLELRIAYGLVTRETAAATRDLALALVSRALAKGGMALTTRVRVVEGSDEGACLALDEDGRAYVLGRDAMCDMSLSDPDVSREHARVVRHANVVIVRDLGAKNGTWLGDTRTPPHSDVSWRPSQMMRIGRTVLALEEPVAEALAKIESAPDEPLPAGEPIAPPDGPSPLAAGVVAPANVDTGEPGGETATVAPIAWAPLHCMGASGRRRKARFSVADVLVMATALGVLALSLAGLVWLLRG